MIINTSSPTYYAPVTLKYLDAKGALKDLKFDAQFKRLKKSEITELREQQRKNAVERAILMEPAMKRYADLKAGLDVSDQISAEESSQIFQEVNRLSDQEAIDILSANMTGWSGVQDEGKNAVPFSMDTLLKACEEFEGLLTAVMQAFSASHTPTAAAHLAAKN